MFAERLLKASDTMVLSEERLDEKEGSTIEHAGHEGEPDPEREGSSKCIHTDAGELTRWHPASV